MSIILGALGGAGEALSNIGATNMKADLDLQNRLAVGQQDSDLALQRAKTLELFKASLGEQQRTDQVKRIDTAAGSIADAKVAEKRGIIEGGIVDRAAWTPEHQAAVDQSLALDRDKLKADPKTRTEAAISTGDISPKDAAVLTQKDDAALYKALWEQQKEDGRNARADARIAAQAEASDKRLAYLFAALEKRGNGDPTKEALAFLEGSRKEVASEAQTLRSLYQSEMKNARFPEDKAKVEAEYKPKFDDIDRKRRQIEADYGAMRSRVGLPPLAGEQPAPTPAPAAPAAAKPGGTRPPLSAFQRK